jgi:hypothetical protein
MLQPHQRFVAFVILFALLNVCFADFQTQVIKTDWFTLPEIDGYIDWSGTIGRPEGQILITKMDWDIIDENGESLVGSQAYLHHMIVYSDPATVITCPNYDGWLGGRGNVSNPLVLPQPYGVFDGSNSIWGLAMHVISQTNEGTRFYGQITVTYSNSPSDFQNYISVVPLYFSVTACSDSQSYNVTAGGPNSLSSKSSLFIMPFNGKVVFGFPHLHNSGVEIILTDETLQDTICDEKPTYSNGNPGTGNQTTITTCVNDEMMWRGDVINVTAVYDSSVERIDVMGLYLIYVTAQ